MAHNSELPCDGDGICMVCKNEPPPEATLTCKTCNTPWHATCLSSPPETLVSTLQWECPDCSPGDAPPVSITGLKSGDLIASIRAIEADASLTELQKAKKRQDLMSSGGVELKNKEEDFDGFDLLDGSLNCSFCMQLPERPVTTPCGHNFCLKCFEKWVRQGKRTCAKCRNTIPPSMASHPRINSSLVVAIRMAKMSKSSTTTTVPLKVYHFIHQQNRPDKAFTTERAKKAGKANACSGKIFVTVPSDHFGPILAEDDPERKQGVLVGESWEDRMECRQWGTHLPHVAGIAGQSEYGAQSVALSGGYEDDEDHGEWFIYTGSGGRDLSGNKRTNKDQSFDQKFEKYNEALRVSCKKGYPVRVVRSHKEKRSSYAPEIGVRYDGIYRIERCWRKVGIQGFKVCRYLFVRCDNEPAPWTSDEHGDRPRPLPVIKELKKATDITERTEKASWDYDEVEEGSWKWKRPPPKSKMGKRPPSMGPPSMGNKSIDNVDLEENERARAVTKQQRNLFLKQKLREKLLKEFSCLICRKVMTLPMTTPCAHNFCKHCLEGAFAGQTLLKERTCEGRRTLRTQKNVMKCPSCPMEIADFLQNPQINRDLMDLIESLKSKTEDNAEEESSKEENDNTEEMPDAGVEENKLVAESFEVLKVDNKQDEKSPLKEHDVLKSKTDDNVEEDEYINEESGKDDDITEEKPKDEVGEIFEVLKGDKLNEKSPLKVPKSGKEDFQTPTTENRRKRKKADNDDFVPFVSEVRTRSMRSKELGKEASVNASHLDKSKRKQANKRKKANDATDTVSKPKLGGVRTRSNKS